MHGSNTMHGSKETNSKGFLAAILMLALRLAGQTSGEPASAKSWSLISFRTISVPDLAWRTDCRSGFQSPLQHHMVAAAATLMSAASD